MTKVTTGMILDNNEIGVNFTVKYERKEDRWKAYEFESDYLYFDNYEQGGSYFRLEVRNEYSLVLFAERDDYTVMEDVTEHFDVIDLLQRVLKQNDIYDAQGEYVNWLLEGENY
jgi:hypothetical protein